MTNQTTEFKKVAVLAGGIGSERPVSLQSGQNIFNAIKQTHLEVVFFDIRPDDMSILDDPSIDIFYLGLHGEFGEDGQLQRVLERRGLCFTGSGSLASELAFNKRKAKAKFIEAGIPTAASMYLDANSRTLDPAQLERLGSKCVIKPLRQGSSVGIQIAEGGDAIRDAAQQCLDQFGDCMIETFVPGREITVGILDTQALPIIEIRPKQKFYDFHAKYEDNSTEYLFDTVASETLVQKIQKAALDSHRVLGCRHLSRVDFILAGDGRFVTLEVNTLPGFTSHSLLPMAAAKAGIPADRLCLKILQAAWNDRTTKTPQMKA